MQLAAQGSHDFWSNDPVYPRVFLFLTDKSSTSATLLASNSGQSYRDLFERACEKIMTLAKPYSDSGQQTAYSNLIALKTRQPVGQWRDSDNGLGSGRYPYDVNTVLMPAALEAIAKLARAGSFRDKDDWEIQARQRTQVWETSTLKFFTVRRFPNPSSVDRLYGLTTL